MDITNARLRSIYAAMAIAIFSLGLVGCFPYGSNGLGFDESETPELIYSGSVTFDTLPAELGERYALRTVPEEASSTIGGECNGDVEWIEVEFAPRGEDYASQGPLNLKTTGRCTNSRWEVGTPVFTEDTLMKMRVTKYVSVFPLEEPEEVFFQTRMFAPRIVSAQPVNTGDVEGDGFFDIDTVLAGFAPIYLVFADLSQSGAHVAIDGLQARVMTTDEAGPICALGKNSDSTGFDNMTSGFSEIHTNVDLSAGERSERVIAVRDRISHYQSCVSVRAERYTGQSCEDAPTQPHCSYTVTVEAPLAGQISLFITNSGGHVNQRDIASGSPDQVIAIPGDSTFNIQWFSNGEFYNLDDIILNGSTYSGSEVDILGEGLNRGRATVSAAVTLMTCSEEPTQSRCSVELTIRSPLAGQITVTGSGIGTITLAAGDGDHVATISGSEVLEAVIQDEFGVDIAPALINGTQYGAPVSIEDLGAFGSTVVISE